MSEGAEYEPTRAGFVLIMVWLLVAAVLLIGTVLRSEGGPAEPAQSLVSLAKVVVGLTLGVLVGRWSSGRVRGDTWILLALVVFTVEAALQQWGWYS